MAKAKKLTNLIKNKVSTVEISGNDVELNSRSLRFRLQRGYPIFWLLLFLDLVRPQSLPSKSFPIHYPLWEPSMGSIIVTIDVT
jgi:hypothetical protein